MMDFAIIEAKRLDILRCAYAESNIFEPRIWRGFGPEYKLHV